MNLKIDLKEYAVLTPPEMLAVKRALLRKLAARLKPNGHPARRTPPMERTNHLT